MEKIKYLCNPSSSVTRVSYEHVWSATVDARSICIGRLLDNQCFLPRFYRLLNLYSIEMDGPAEQHGIVGAGIEKHLRDRL